MNTENENKIGWLKSHNDESNRKTALRKKRALWEKSQSRKTGKRSNAIAYSSPSTENEKLETAEKLIAKVIRVIQSKGFTFSSFDLEDMKQAGKFALVEGGFFETGVINSDSFKDIRNAIGSRDCMRLQCKWETTSSEFETLTEIGVFHEFEQCDKLNSKTVSIMRACMRTLRKAHSIDDSRRASANFTANKKFFLACVKESTGKSNGNKLKKSTFSMRKKTFIAYLASGAKALQPANTKTANKALELEILSNLEKNLLAN
jgi:hypothetical protein